MQKSFEEIQGFFFLIYVIFYITGYTDKKRQGIMLRFI
jgi:hypothetical protein